MTRQPRVLIFTGDGKGKTTAALGMALRATGHAMRICIVQFIKSDDSVGEHRALAAMPNVRLIQTGLGFVPRDACSREPHRFAAVDGLREARQAIASADYDLIILDEICNAVSYGFLEESAVAELVNLAPPTMCLVLTGRGATPGLIDLADTVTEMRCVKHAYRTGRAAERGVEK